jgi:hypothetical protein
MTIRSYQRGDENAQVAIYNEAAGHLPKFKPATLDEVRRRLRAPDFDPATKLYAVEGGQPVAYATFHGNGRVSYPWCRKGFEHLAEPLFQGILQAMKGRGMTRAFAAYRADWPTTQEFFLSRGFTRPREMVSFVLDIVEMPTPAARPSSPFTPLQRADVPHLLKLAPEALRVSTAPEMEKHLFANPHFGPESVFILRARGGDTPVAAGIVIDNPSFADPKQLDASMPCFRLGAFGTETMQTKRVNGLFSFLAKADGNANPLALDLMGHAAFRLRETETESLAAQVPSDAPHLLRFYQQHFRRQGSFPVFEKTL